MTAVPNYPTTPALVWRYFSDLAAIPRPSKQEEGVRNYLVAFAKSNHFEHQLDGVGNVYIRVPATSGYETHAPLMIQNHMDMVCDAVPGHTIDFSRDPIELRVVDGWVKANQTTLGADNGIGMAFALAVATDPSVAHPPLELVFTVDEETGLHGAQNLEGTFIQSQRMLNFDSEDWGAIYIGCAGGVQVELEGLFECQRATQEASIWRLEIKGFTGGHSGIDIHRQRGSAIALLNDIAHEMSAAKMQWQMATWNAGKAHNIIPRDARMEFALVGATAPSELQALIERVSAKWRSFLPEEDHAFTSHLERIKESAQSVSLLTPASQRRLLSLLALMPHGVHSYVLEAKDRLPSLSSNFARMQLENGKLYIESSIRFFNRQECFKLLNHFEALAHLSGVEFKQRGEYPGWKPEFKTNRLLSVAQNCFEKNFNLKPEVLAIHAGLECGIIKGRLQQDIDAISIGPNIRGAHSPDERVEIESVTKFWKFVVALLAEL